MTLEAPRELSAAQKAWVTRRARAQARADQVAVAKGVATPPPEKIDGEPIVQLYVDEPSTGTGFRRFVVLSVGPKYAVLFHPATLSTLRVERPTFDRWATPARSSRPRAIAAIIRRNMRQADRLEQRYSQTNAEQAIAILKA